MPVVWAAATPETVTDQPSAFELDGIRKDILTGSAVGGPMFGRKASVSAGLPA